MATKSPIRSRETTRDSAVLDWGALTKPQHAERLKLVRDLLRVRRDHVVPLLPTDEERRRGPL